MVFLYAQISAVHGWFGHKELQLNMVQITIIGKVGQMSGLFALTGGTLWHFLTQQ